MTNSFIVHYLLLKDNLLDGKMNILKHICRKRPQFIATSDIETDFLLPYSANRRRV